MLNPSPALGIVAPGKMYTCSASSLTVSSVSCSPRLFVSLQRSHEHLFGSFHLALLGVEVAKIMDRVQCRCVFHSSHFFEWTALFYSPCQTLGVSVTRLASNIFHFNDGDGENHDPAHCLSELTLSEKRVIMRLLLVQQFDVYPYSFSLGYSKVALPFLPPRRDVTG